MIQPKLQPREYIFRVVNLGAAGNRRAVDHQDRQAKFARGNQFRVGALSAGVLAYHQIDRVGLHQGAVGLGCEGTTIYDEGVVEQRRWAVRRVDEAQQVVVLGLGRELLHMHSAECQHDAAGRSDESCDGGFDIGHTSPAVTRNRLPDRACQGNEGYIRQPCCFHRVRAHCGGEGVGGVDQMGHSMITQIGGKSHHAAEAANARGHGLGARTVRPSRVAQRCAGARVCQQASKGAGLGRAAQEQDVWHG